jgi:hypothetical protein
MGAWPRSAERRVACIVAQNAPMDVVAPAIAWPPARAVALGRVMHFRAGRLLIVGRRFARDRGQGRLPEPVATSSSATASCPCDSERPTHVAPFKICV